MSYQITSAASPGKRRIYTDEGKDVRDFTGETNKRRALERETDETFATGSGYGMLYCSASSVSFIDLTSAFLADTFSPSFSDRRRDAYRIVFAHNQVKNHHIVMFGFYSSSSFPSSSKIPASPLPSAVPEPVPAPPPLTPSPVPTQQPTKILNVSAGNQEISPEPKVLRPEDIRTGNWAKDGWKAVKVCNCYY